MKNTINDECNIVEEKMPYYKYQGKHMGKAMLMMVGLAFLLFILIIPVVGLEEIYNVTVGEAYNTSLPLISGYWFCLCYGVSVIIVMGIIDVGYRWNMGMPIKDE